MISLGTLRDWHGDRLWKSCGTTVLLASNAPRHSSSQSFSRWYTTASDTRNGTFKIE